MMLFFRLSGRTDVALPVNEIDIYRILETAIKYQNHKKKSGKTAQ